MPYTFRIRGRLYENLSFDDTRREIQAYGQRIYTEIDGNILAAEHIAHIHSAQPIVATICDAFNGFASPPDLREWRSCLNRVAEIREIIAIGNLGVALRAFHTLSLRVTILRNQLDAYSGNMETGATRAITTLEFIRDASAVTVVAIAALPVAAGGLALSEGAVAATGAGYSLAQGAIQQTAEVHYNLRDRIDWEGLTFDATVNMLLSYFGGRLITGVAARLGAAPAFRSITSIAQRVVTPEMISNAVATLLVNRGSGVVTIILRATFDAIRPLPASQRPTWDGVIEQLTRNFMQPSFFDLVAGEISRVHGPTVTVAPR